ncbi:MAG: carbohydrate kinase family protein [Firmicutes bacterium]|nr:carbohydrate kinase family protein [Bacillota bacterium]
MKRGITVAGNIIVDHIKAIDVYPQENHLCNISDVSKSVGGAVCNTGIVLAALDKSLGVTAAGRVGGDADGAYAIGRMRDAGMDISRVKVTPGAPTSFTDVMTAAGTGARTFFHARGANALFDYGDIGFDSLDCDIFHMGYALLLDKFDAPDPVCGTVMARALREVQNAKIKTSIDVVSEAGSRFARVVTPALKYCNYAVLNETESGMVTGIEPRSPDGRILPENIEKICRAFVALGVSEAVAVHCPEAGFMMDASGAFTTAPSLNLPAGYIKGTAGAGDAFCAGVLYALYKGFASRRALETGAACAAASLSACDGTGGARDFESTMGLVERYGFREGLF